MGLLSRTFLLELTLLTGRLYLVQWLKVFLKVEEEEDEPGGICSSQLSHVGKYILVFFAAGS